MSDANGSGIETALVGALQQQRVAAHLDEPRDRALADLLAAARAGSRFVVSTTARLVLVARVDDRVELLEHPRRALLGADVVDVQQVDGGQAVQQRGEAGLRVVVERLAQQAEQPRQRVDRDRVALRPAPRSRSSIASVVLPVPTSPSNQMPRRRRGCSSSCVDVAADLAHDRRLDQRHRRAVEADALVAARDHAPRACAPCARAMPARAAAAVARAVVVVFVVRGSRSRRSGSSGHWRHGQ